MGRHKKIISPKALRNAWEEYKACCDNKVVPVQAFSSKEAMFVADEVRKRVSYTIEGFCVFLGIPRATFYANYTHDDKYLDMVTRIREECEADAREKFETGELPTQLAGLWMTRYGYSSKSEETDTAALDKLDDILAEIKADAERSSNSAVHD